MRVCRAGVHAGAGTDPAKLKGKTMHNTPHRPVLLANGKPAYTRGGLVTQRMINEHGSYQAARAYVAKQKETQQ